MLYLSAQPDTIYFIWQLEIHSLHIQKENIHVLIAYNQDVGLNPDCQNLINENKHLAQFYIYPDLREKPKYSSSVRPNILKEHFRKFPELSEMAIMYHDSDILFSRIPKIEDVENSDICYVSDTRNYLDINYIRATSNEDLLDKMLSIVGLSKEKLIQENEQTGGAQYILKGITADFWEKVESDSENLYVAMKDFNGKLWEREYPEKRDYRSEKRGIQAWCADMWAVLWNLWLEDKPVQIHPEMGFSWPYSSIEDWNRLAIQHYSGNIEDKTKFFKKTEYLNYMPWYHKELDIIPETNCSYKIVELIKKRKEELDALRPEYNDIALVFDGRIATNHLLSNFETLATYVQKYLAIDLLLLVDDESLSIHQNVLLPPQLKTLREKYERVIYFSNVLLLPIDDIENLLSKDKYKDRNYIITDIYQVDSLFLEAFSKTLDSDLLELNKGKFNISNRDDFVVNRKTANFDAQFKFIFSDFELQNTTLTSSAYLLK